jgi:hypothetical protein
MNVNNSLYSKLYNDVFTITRRYLGVNTERRERVWYVSFSYAKNRNIYSLLLRFIRIRPLALLYFMLL